MGNLEIITGHGRMAAAHDMGITEVPAIILSHLTDAQKRAYRIADNNLTELGKWSIVSDAITMATLPCRGRILLHRLHRHWEC